MAAPEAYLFSMRKRAAASLVVIAVAFSNCGRAPAGRRLIVHDFSTSAEGWQIAGDTGPAAPVFEPTGGRSGGYISNADEAVGETWYFQAPATVLAQVPAAEGGRLEYMLRQSSADAGFPDDDVVIVGPAGRLSYRFDYAPGTDWTDFSVQLSASANWRWNWNARATEEQIRSVLSHPSRLEIRGEYRTGDDVGAMDRFALTSGGD
jgi:hypothetical protein